MSDTTPRHARFDVKARIVKWLNKQDPGTIFTADTLIEALNDDGGTEVHRQLITQNLSRMTPLGIGIERKHQGIYVWNPKRAKPGSTRAARGPRPVPPEVTPLAIASPKATAPIVPEPSAEVPAVRETAGVGAAPAAPLATAPMPTTPAPAASNNHGTFPPGSLIMLSVLTDVPGGFLAQNVDTRTVYRVSEVNS